MVYSPTKNMKNFRELAPIELWSSQICSGLDKDTFSKVLSEVAVRENFTFFGFFVFNGLSSWCTEYHFTRYPRRKYGIPSIQRCNEMLVKIFLELSTKDHHIEGGIEELSNQSRVVLGLLEGYNQSNHTHSVEEVQDTLGIKYLVQQAQIYTVGPKSTYCEPAAVISTKPENVPQIYHLAANFKQERFTVENFASHTSHVVETSFAKHPDSE